MGMVWMEFVTISGRHSGQIGMGKKTNFKGKTVSRMVMYPSYFFEVSHTRVYTITAVKHRQLK